METNIKVLKVILRAVLALIFKALQELILATILISNIHKFYLVLFRGMTVIKV